MNQGRNAGSPSRRRFLRPLSNPLRFFSPLANEEPKAQRSKGPSESASRGWGRGRIDAPRSRESPARTLRAGLGPGRGASCRPPLQAPLCSSGGDVVSDSIPLSAPSVLPPSEGEGYTSARADRPPRVGNCYFGNFYCFFPLSSPINFVKAIPICVSVP